MSSAALKTIAQHPIVSRVRDLYTYQRDKRAGTFSQHGEDVWLDNHFGGKRGGFYVDIGASHPTRLSNTWKLYSERDWRGVTVEPIPALAETHRKWRPRDTLVQACIGTEAGKGIFYEMSPSVLSTMNDLAALKSIAAGEAKNWREYEINIITLDQLFDNYISLETDGPIDLLSIDIEGMDADVLTGCAFDRFRPRVIIAEANDRQTRMRLLAHLKGRCGYRLAAEKGCNLIFLERQNEQA